MADQLAKAQDFENKAEKKLNGWGLFSSKYEDAADLFDKAANCYKLAKACKFLRYCFLLLFLDLCMIRLIPFFMPPCIDLGRNLLSVA